MHIINVDVRCEESKHWFHFCAKYYMSHSEEAEEDIDDDLSVEFLKQLMTSWQECHLISEEYFPNKLAVFSMIDHYYDNIMSYYHNLLLQLAKKKKKSLSFINLQRKVRKGRPVQVVVKGQLLVKGTVMVMKTMMMFNSSQTFINSTSQPSYPLMSCRPVRTQSRGNNYHI